jgi:hypothetical protein
MVYAGACSASFQQGRKDLKNLADLDIASERVRRATTRNGKARLELMRRLEEAFLEKSIPNQLESGPAEKTPPPIAVVMCDGGKYQRFDRGQGKPESGSFCRESRVACLLSMTAASYGRGMKRGQGHEKGSGLNAAWLTANALRVVGFGFR